MDFIRNKILKFTQSDKKENSYELDIDYILNGNKSDYIFHHLNNNSNNNLDTNLSSNFKIKELNREDMKIKFSHLYDIPIFKKILSKTDKISENDTLLRTHQILDEISQGGFYSLDGTNLQNLMFHGMPDEIPVLRTLIWKLALKYPKIQIIHTPKWQIEINKQRNDYFQLVKEHYKYLNNKNLQERNKNLINLDHPLNNKEDSDWNNYFKDSELVEEIHKDVRRTRAQMSFFFMPADETLNISNEEITIKANYIIDHTQSSKNKIEKDFETHGDVLTRILYIFAKEYPNIRYVQGMNEVLATIYYQFCQDNDCDNDQFSNYIIERTYNMLVYWLY